MAEFKRLSDVESVVEPIETANILIEENGVIKKAPKTSIGGVSDDYINSLIDAKLGVIENGTY